MYWKEYVVSDYEMLFGEPVIKGTRIPVDLLLEKLAARSSRQEILKAYPRLTSEDIQACLLFAARK
jgi:uncharacterized protein (DUF433 family)